MIMVLAVLAGSLAGLMRALIGKRPYRIAGLCHGWLVMVATVPQMIAFELPGTRSSIPSGLAPVILVGSQFLLMVFTALNLRRTGIWLAGVGLGMNLAVISANGGLMPVSPKTVKQLWPQAIVEDIQPGTRLGWSKDIVLPEEKTRFSWLSDRFIMPSLSKSRIAFSLGDLVIALGAFIFFWALGGPVKKS
jgi:hypothetical protein